MSYFFPGDLLQRKRRRRRAAAAKGGPNRSVMERRGRERDSIRGIERERTGYISDRETKKRVCV